MSAEWDTPWESSLWCAGETSPTWQPCQRGMSIFHEQAETHKHTQQVLAVTDNSGTGETAMHNAMVLPGSQGGGNPDRHSETCAKFNLSPACRDTCKQAMIEASVCKNTVLALPIIISVFTISYFFCRWVLCTFTWVRMAWDMDKQE